MADLPVRTADRAMGPQVAVHVAERLRALADPLRLRMLSAIATSASGEVAAGQLASITDVTQPTVSHHLKLLKDAGVLVSERRATSVFYRIAPGVENAVILLLDAFAPTASAQGTASAVANLDAHGLDPLLHADTIIERIGARLTERFADLNAEMVTRTLRESYAALVRTARVTRYLPVLAERFAGQRLEDIRRTQNAAGSVTRKPQVLFVCVANAGRSQLAAALLERYAGSDVVVRSAGSMPAEDIHATVRPVLEDILGPDTDPPFPKPLTDDAVRAADVVITMGCGDVCPVLPGTRYEDWAVGDPALASPEGVHAIRDDIDRRVRQLAAQLLHHPVPADLPPIQQNRRTT